MKYHVTLTSEAKQTITVEVEADSQDEANDLATADPFDFQIVDETIEGFHDYEIESSVEVS